MPLLQNATMIVLVGRRSTRNDGMNVGHGSIALDLVSLAPGVRIPWEVVLMSTRRTIRKKMALLAFAAIVFGAGPWFEAASVSASSDRVLPLHVAHMSLVAYWGLGYYRFETRDRATIKRLSRAARRDITRVGLARYLARRRNVDLPSCGYPAVVTFYSKSGSPGRGPVAFAENACFAFINHPTWGERSRSRGKVAKVIGISRACLPASKRWYPIVDLAGLFYKQDYGHWNDKKARQVHVRGGCASDPSSARLSPASLTGIRVLLATATTLRRWRQHGRGR